MAKKVPEMVRKARGREVAPEEIGPPNAEPKGIWRVLRNSLLMAVALFALIFVGYVVS